MKPVYCYTGDTLFNKRSVNTVKHTVIYTYIQYYTQVYRRFADDHAWRTGFFCYDTANTPCLSCLTQQHETP